MKRIRLRIGWQEAWRAVLLGLALLQGSVLLNIERERLAEARSIESRLATRAGPQTYNPTLDPRPGQALPRLTLKDLSGHNTTVPPRTPGHQAVLVFVGTCSACVVDKLKSWQEAANSNRSVYIVTMSSVDEVRDFRKRYKITLPFLFDRTEAPQLRPYNVAWRPRAYLIDETAKLLYCQPQYEDSETARKRVVTLRARRPDPAAIERRKEKISLGHALQTGG